MYAIYDNADAAIIWLGEGDEDSDTAMDFVVESQIARHMAQNPHHNYLDHWQHYSDHSPGLTSKECGSCKKSLRHQFPQCGVMGVGES